MCSQGSTSSGCLTSFACTRQLPHRTLDNTTNTHQRALAIHFMDAMAKPMGKERQQEPSKNMLMVRGQGVSSKGKH